MNGAADAPMRRPDWFARFLARVLPWFDQAAYDRERARTRRVLHQADRVLDGSERIRLAYQHYADGMKR